ncbi:MAG: HAD-IA family hydrolase, partial [Actinomycetota bacterium]
FDFDGTLVDSSYAVEKLFQYFKQKYKKTYMDREQFRKINALPLMQKIKKMGVPLYKLPAISLEAKRVYFSYIGKIKIIKGIADLLVKLGQSGLDLSILSSNSVRNINHFLNINKINCFSDIYSAPNMLKKNEDIIKLLKKKKLAKENILYIGDELHDIVACKRIPVKVAAVTWGLDSIDILKSGKPDCICSTPMEIYEYIYENNV